MSLKVIRRILILVILILFINFFRNINTETFETNNDKIFVSIASYRDPQLSHTLKSIINKCSDVSRLSIVICEQNDVNDDFNIDSDLPNVKIIRMNSKDAKGPCWARYLIQQEWTNEKYYLQIDSHTRFVDNWDIKLISDLDLLPPLSCLTNYVSTYDLKTEKIIGSPLRGPMFVSEIDKKDKFVRFNSKYIRQGSLTIPPLSKGWSGCFSFSSAQIIIDAPYDKKTPFLFFGEEMDIYARLFTRGWLMYVPTVPICFTLFDRSYRKTFWEHPDCKKIAPISRQRVHDRFKGIVNDKITLGNIQTMDEFMKHIL